MPRPKALREQRAWVPQLARRELERARWRAHRPPLTQMSAQRLEAAGERGVVVAPRRLQIVETPVRPGARAVRGRGVQVVALGRVELALSLARTARPQVVVHQGTGELLAHEVDVAKAGGGVGKQ